MSSTSPPRPLTEEQIDTYYCEGYLLARGLVPEAAIDSVMREAMKVPPDASGRWTPKVFEHDQPEVDAGLHRLLVEPRIIAAVEQILEAPARIYFGMLAIVPARGGKGLPWHQDNMYDVVLGRALNAFVALCDITPDKAILWVAPRTHLMGVLESEVEEGHRSAKPPANGMPLPAMKKGDVAIFDRNTLHHSKKNDTDEHRYAYAAQFIEDKARGANGRRDATKILASESRERWLR